MKLKRHVVIPAALLVYLSAMAYLGWDGLRAGQTSPLHYFGVIGVTLVVIVLLYFSMKRRDRLRREREADISRVDQPIDKH